MNYLAQIDSGNGGETTIVADTMAEALDLAEDWALEGDWDTDAGTVWVSVSVSDGAGETRYTKVDIDPSEPECSHDDGHDWQAPYEIVGGIKENPGVFGSGGGVTIREVCLRCGCGRLIDTWAQDPSDGEQGLKSVCYTPEQYADEVEELRDAEAE